MKNKSAQESSSSDYSGSVRERILAAAGALSRQQRVIADFLLDHLQEVPFLSVMEIAERTQTSEATVVRLGQRLGYKGYARLKMALVDMLREEREGGDRAQAALPADVGKDVLAAMSRLEITTIERTLDSIDRRAFERSATLMAEADHVFCFGLGISAHLAELAAYLFTEHGVRATALDSRFTSPREQLVVMRPGDIILGLSFQPYSQATLEVLEEAQSRGLATVAITDRATAPAVAHASEALLVSCQGMTFTNTTASVDVLLNALAVRVAARRGDQSTEVLARINDILNETTDLVGDD